MIVGRSEERELATACLDAGRGVALTGAAGTGKTHLARALARGFDGTVSTGVCAAPLGDVPFGALMSLVRPESLAGGPGAVLSATAARLGHADQLLVVDDAQFLDGWSSVLLQQLLEGTACRVVITVRTSDPVPDAVARLWESGAMDRVELGPFDRAETAALAAAELGSDLDGDSASRLWRLTRGNPLYAREVMLDARASGDLTHTGGYWRFERQAGPGTRLTDLIGRRLGPLDSDVRRVVGLVSLGEPVGWASLRDIVGSDAVARAIDAGLVERRADGRREVVWLGHPLYGDVVRALLDPDERTDLATALLEQLERSGVRRTSDLGSGAVLALESGQWHRVDLLARAADQLVDLDPALADRLASAALTRGPDALASAVLARKAGRAGDFDLCEKHARAALDDDAASPRARARAAEALAAALFLLRLDVAGTIRVATAELERVGPVEGAELSARLAAAHSTALDLASVRAVTNPALAADIPVPARLRMVFAQATLEGVVGQAESAARLASAAFPLAVEYATVFTAESGDVAAAAVISHMLAGHLDRADELTEEFAAIEEIGWGDILRGMVALDRGRLRDAATMLERGARTAAATVAGVRDGFALVLAAQAHGTLGDMDSAEADLGGAAGVFGSQPIAVSHMAQARALIQAGRGDRGGAVERLLEVAAMILELGVHMDALRALHTAVRLGAPAGALDMVDRIQVDGVLAPVVVDRIRGSRDRDPETIARAAGVMESLGAELWAGEAYLAAADVLERSQRARAATDARARGLRLVERCGAAGPTLRHLQGLTPLTGREREVVELAGMGLSNKEIAERLVVGTRTVEGHLHRAYVKLGVTSRAELSVRLGSGG